MGFLANERTFLGYLRTAQAFSMMGVFIAQLMRLRHSPNPRPVFGFYAVSVPLASICQVMAILFSIVGCIRFFKYQKNMALGAALSGGWEIGIVGLLTWAVSQCLSPELWIINLHIDDSDPVRDRLGSIRELAVSP